ncbi:MAG: hypothetical protein JXO22_13020 [Phycisphaerae bacterium]|nr:hypothetical protein [Phycisphaerae bacterium]
MPADYGQSRDWALRGLVLVTAGAALITVLATGCGRGPDAEVRRLLNSEQAEDHKRGAWLAADTGHIVVLDELVHRVTERAETPDVREAYVYSLGLLGDSRATDALLAVIATEQSGYLRQAAWLALARVNADAFREQAAQVGDADEWDRIGLAQGYMELGEYGDVPLLVTEALASDTWRGDIAARAIQRWVSPLLDAVGRWPLELAEVRPEDWTGEQVALVAERIDATDLQAIADDTLPHLEKSRHVHSNEAKLNKARDRIARVLFWALAENADSAP